MTAVSLTFLIVCAFGALAYGSSTVMALRQATPVWGSAAAASCNRPSALGRVSLAMFAVCTAWFTLNALAEFDTLAFGERHSNWIDLGILTLAFVFPPLIMHLVHHEAAAAGSRTMDPAWRWPLPAMYVISPAIGIFIVGAAVGAWARPAGINRMIGSTFGLLFTAASVYSSLVMLRSRQRTEPTVRRRLGNTMLGLFGFITLVFLGAALLDDRSQLIEVFDRVTRASPLLFLVAAVYFENRFEFYDLIVKRGVMLLATVLTFGLVFTLVQPLLDGLPRGSVRPWLAAVLLVPVAIALPWMSRTLSAGLDRLWFGRKFSAVDAVKHLLGAMQPATDERTLTEEAERRLADIFNAPIDVRVDDQPVPDGRSVYVETATPAGGRVRCAVPADAGARRFLSEDLTMLRSLASVFGFMLETIRLQQKRQEQEQVAQQLRLQTSRSELKALRAQINPHFLFNALNAIASLIHTDPARADEAVEQLAEVFRYTLRRSESEWAPLDQEVAFARAYLDVERARFGSRLTCTIASDHATPAPMVPSMLLQTLIENAVKHGVSQTRGPGRIDVTVCATVSDITVEVRDNGPGPGAAGVLPREGEGFGLRSVRERLAAHFGERARLSLIRDEGSAMTIARITMPAGRVAA
ncbi:MAG TPA: histidine kinase [Vicinamibacterales bacterium]|nr:histidine kinase [Vicinamibacterales bacterium]